MLKRKFFLAFLGILFGIFAGFALLEIALRLMAPEWLVHQMKELNLARNVTAFGTDVGWSVESIDGKFVRFVPSTEFQVRYYEYNHSVHIDEIGGRVVAEDASEKERVPVVPILGDSFTFGLGVADEETFASLLNSRPDYRIINLGVPGSSLPNQLDQIEFRHKELGSPSVYVFGFFTGNDYSDLVRYYSKTKLGIDSGRQAPGAFIRWLDRVVYRNPTWAKSYFLQLIKHTLLKDYFYTGQMMRSILPRPCGIPVKGRPPVTNSALMIMAGKKKCISEIESNVKAAVDRLSELSRRMKFTAIFVIIPDKLQVMPSLLETKAAAAGLEMADLDLQAPSKIIARQLKTNGIRSFDLADCLQGKDGMYYKADDHFTPDGHRAAAECLSENLHTAILEGMWR